MVGREPLVAVDVVLAASVARSEALKRPVEIALSPDADVIVRVASGVVLVLAIPSNAVDAGAEPLPLSKFPKQLVSRDPNV